MIPLSQALLLSSYPKERAGSALSMWAITTLVAPVIGPVLGGWITDNISWPWIFYINVPFGLVAGIATWLIYRDRETPTQKSLPIDRVGLGLLVVWVGCLQVTLDKGNDLDWFNSATIVTLAVISAFTFVLFLVWELTTEHPVVELTLFKRRNFWVATVVVLVGYGLYFGNIVLMPLWLQQHMGYTATLAGVVLAPVGILAIFLTPLVGRYVTRIDPRLFVTGSMLVFALVLFMRAHFNTDASFRVLLLPTLIQGIAMALFFIPLISLSLSGLPPARIPAAAGLYNFARITAGSFGTSLITTFWDRRATLHHSQLVEALGSNPLSLSPVVGDLQARGFDAQQTYGLLNRLVDEQAFMLSTNDMFLISGVLFLLMVFLIWFARPPRPDAASAAAGRDAAAGAH
jgi:DHA2 family multidrug resistance protein